MVYLLNKKEVKEIQETAKGNSERIAQEQGLQFKAALEGMKLAEERRDLEHDKKDLQETKEVS